MEIENISYDILDWFPILYCQDVFKFLDGKDIIQASAVNKEWNKLASERQQVEKLKLVIDGFTTRDKAIILKNSKRNY